MFWKKSKEVITRRLFISWKLKSAFEKDIKKFHLEPYLSICLHFLRQIFLLEFWFVGLWIANLSLVLFVISNWNSFSPSGFQCIIILSRCNIWNHNFFLIQTKSCISQLFSAAKNLHPERCAPDNDAQTADASLIKKQFLFHSMGAAIRRYASSREVHTVYFMFSVWFVAFII